MLEFTRQKRGLPGLWPSEVPNMPKRGLSGSQPPRSKLGSGGRVSNPASYRPEAHRSKGKNEVYPALDSGAKNTHECEFYPVRISTDPFWFIQEYRTESRDPGRHSDLLGKTRFIRILFGATNYIQKLSEKRGLSGKPCP